MSREVQEAIKNSLEIEKHAMNFYRYAAQRFKDADSKRMFEFLSKEEREHASHFFRIYQGDDIPSLEVFLESQSDFEAGWLATAIKSFGEDLTEKKAMEIALEKEINLEKSLRNMAENMKDPEVRAVYELNINETHNHYLMIESEYARIMKMVHETDMDIYVRE